MKLTSLIGAAVVLASVAGMGGCSKRTEEIGPAQKAGAAIDNAGDKVAEEIHEKLDKARAVGETLEERAKVTGEKIDEATQDASRGINKATEKVGQKVEKAGEEIQEAARK